MQNKTHNEFIIKTSPNGDKTILYAYLGSESVVSVPEGVTDINFFAFAEEHKPNDTITKIILPDSVTNEELKILLSFHSKNMKNSVYLLEEEEI